MAGQAETLETLLAHYDKLEEAAVDQFQHCHSESAAILRHTKTIQDLQDERIGKLLQREYSVIQSVYNEAGKEIPLWLEGVLARIKEGIETHLDEGSRDVQKVSVNGTKALAEYGKEFALDSKAGKAYAAGIRAEIARIR